MAVLCSTQVMWPLPLVELHAVGRAWNPNVAKSRETGVFLPVRDSSPPIFAPGVSIRPPPAIRKHAALTAQNSGRGATERAGVAESRQATATTAAASSPGTRMRCLRCIMCVLPPPLLVRAAWMPHPVPHGCRTVLRGKASALRRSRKTRLIFRELGAFVARSRRRARIGFPATVASSAHHNAGYATASSGSLDASLVTLGTDAAGSGVRSTPRGHWCFAQLPTSLGYDARLPTQRARRTISMWASCAAIGSEPFCRVPLLYSGRLHNAHRRPHSATALCQREMRSPPLRSVSRPRYSNRGRGSARGERLGQGDRAAR